MDKQKFRKLCLEKIRAKNRGNRYVLDKLVVKKLSVLIENRASKVVMLYIPLKIEINIHSLINQLRKEKKIVLVPFMEGKSFRLVKYRLPLKIKKFGVKEPNNSNKYTKKIDLAIVPILGTDSTLRRVGFGKGFYDRFFEKNSKNIKEIIFVGLEYCVSSEIITQSHDIKGNGYLTPKNSFLNENQGFRLLK
ncbi:5-formyltetrahydrofolate cyclo-ligase [hydrothermal vent metagenome]|uniref:5-formyltetrahydrofolate cyclo-ligase n=1 Tax=hydrothermal vent metagenome TaxID=652676 RepID=A0A1W1CMC5_9ZZZZ